MVVVDLFYVRNHLPVPEVDPATYELEISGIGVKEVVLKLKDLDKYKTYTITAAIQCAGNRRSEMSKVKPVKGLNWGQAAIGNAEWSGPRLYDVLTDAGLKVDQPGVHHIQFEGLDTDPANVPYGASIPIEKAMDPNGDVILATKMNGQPLSRDHGFPVRVIVPGVVGARNVKWLGKIVVSGEESKSHWQQNDYKGFCPSVDWDTVDFSKAPAIQELPVISGICDPIEGESVTLRDGKLKVRGELLRDNFQQVRVTCLFLDTFITSFDPRLPILSVCHLQKLKADYEGCMISTCVSRLMAPLIQNVYAII
ncbi:hypothetical protein J437_LFUL008793 [Ladona fulva]|uniref:Oxidoreductase molybdopterin-binding domain-containing protein n=1 Tax=Ladona fulva TaxID=123851 RepID=A0A8K0K7J7_LADFU|nr:hypothetical protein J437_LFUL008793 [Ladona fulva]